MTEDKVRKAFDVAHELASKAQQETSEPSPYRDVFNTVFNAMIHEPWGGRPLHTATGVSLTQLNDNES